MNINEIVKQLRVMAAECENKSTLLPREIVEIINGKQENGWSDIPVNKVLQYFADLLEE